MANAVVAISARRRTREIRVCGAGVTVKPVETKFEDKPIAMRIKVEFIKPPLAVLDPQLDYEREFVWPGTCARETPLSLRLLNSHG